MDEFMQVFITAGSNSEARQIARVLVERRLAGCVQILSPMESVYWWQGEVESAEECLCLIKTSRARYADLEAAIKELHSYDTPEILAMSVAEGNGAYLDWLREELGGD